MRMTALSPCMILPPLLIWLQWIVYSVNAALSLNLYADLEHSPFELGVASADPEPDSVVIWTRAQKNGPVSTFFTEDQNVTWRIWKSDDANVEQNGTVLAEAARDFTVTVIVDGLDPDTFYQYEFVHEASGNRSVEGRTRTAPTLDAEQTVRIAGVSCSSIWSGYMNTYARIADLDDLNVVVHVGDFIYPELDRSSCQRVPLGLDSRCRNECLGKELPQEQAINVSSLIQRHNCTAPPVDYFRWVYQYYLHDPLVREFRRSHPIISIFDNHDVDSSRSENFTMDGGIQAFMEYIPSRAKVSPIDNSTIHFFRSFRFGKMVDLIALDTRALGVKIPGDGTYLGQPQLQWLGPTMVNSTVANWRIFLTTVAFAPWAVNGWDVYVNSVFAGVFVALLLLTVGCIGTVCYYRRRNKRKLSAEDGNTAAKVDEETPTEGITIPVEARRKRIAVQCCMVYGGCSVVILIIIWITATVLVNKVLAGRKLSVASSGNSLTLIAAQDRNWDGHPGDRRDFLQRMRDANITKNNVWFSGDLHMSLASDVRDIDQNDWNSVYKAERFGVEMLSSSVSRANIDEILSSYMPRSFVPAAVNVVETVMYRANPHFRYYEVTEHGYGILIFSRQNVTGQYWHTPLLEDASNQWLAREVVCPVDENQWI